MRAAERRLTIAPSGKFGADPTSMMVFGFLLVSSSTSLRRGQAHIARFIRLTSALRDAESTGITCSLIPKYCEAFQNAACADEGMTLTDKLNSSMPAYISGRVIPFVARAQSR